jgi:hypothetical protein
MEFLKKNSIETIEWMDKGADINIIEHVWAAMKDYLYENRRSLKNK